jgi:hypothetical protein
MTKESNHEIQHRTSQFMGAAALDTTRISILVFIASFRTELPSTSAPSATSLLRRPPLIPGEVGIVNVMPRRGESKCKCRR